MAGNPGSTIRDKYHKIRLEFTLIALLQSPVAIRRFTLANKGMTTTAASGNDYAGNTPTWRLLT
jgi:hypothetical protein